MGINRDSKLRNYDATAYWADYEHWKSDLVEVNFFNPYDRENADLDALLTDAWNFLAAEEAEEERQAELRELEEEEGLDELGIPYLD